MKFSKRNIICILLFASAYTLRVCAQTHARNFGDKRSPDEKVLSLDTATRSGHLKNGFTYFIRHNDEPKNRVVMYLVNKVGSILEDEDQRGLAHFMEHMSFNGTKHFPKNELID